jgi:hypothetical protein
MLKTISETQKMQHFRMFQDEIFCAINSPYVNTKQINIVSLNKELEASSTFVISHCQRANGLLCYLMIGGGLVRCLILIYKMTQ